MQGSSSDEDIRLRKELATCPKLSSDECKSSRNCAVDAKHVYRSEKATKDRLVVPGIAAVIDALVDLPEGNDANGDAIVDQTIEERHSAGAAFEIVCDPVAVYEILHSSTGGRSLMRRAA
jgi:hypothetical protein